MKLLPTYTIATTAELHSAIVAVNGADYRFEGPMDAFRILGKRKKKTFQIQLEDAACSHITGRYADRFKNSQNGIANPKMFMICYAEEERGKRNINLRQLEGDISEITGFLGRQGFLVHCYKHEEESIPAQKTKSNKSKSDISRTA